MGHYFLDTQYTYMLLAVSKKVNMQANPKSVSLYNEGTNFENKKNVHIIIYDLCSYWILPEL